MDEQTEAVIMEGLLKPRKKELMEQVEKMEYDPVVVPLDLEKMSSDYKVSYAEALKNFEGGETPRKSAKYDKMKSAI
jgi:hypothetical protein